MNLELLFLGLYDQSINHGSRPLCD